MHWLKTGKCKHKTSHVIQVEEREGRLEGAQARRSTGRRSLQREKAIMGVFDEGCMGMFNAIIPDQLLNPTGVYKERLSQSALYYETTQVSDDEAERRPADGWKTAG